VSSLRQNWLLNLFEGALVTVNLPSFRLDGRTAIVTGGAGGIGRAVAQGLAEAGAHVVVLDSDGSAAAKVANEIGAKASAAQADVTDGEAIVIGALALAIMGIRASKVGPIAPTAGDVNERSGRASSLAI
jgi:NAD(P)-dependent dehydrogenase (short-subunit alcohol dehydrogenase family)